jgi:parallel beta-helix repeat protein
MTWHPLFPCLPSQTAGHTRRTRAPRHFGRPRLEALEDRTVLQATLVVSPGGTVLGSFASVQAAVNAAAPSGDTILVDPGTYTEQVTINKSLTIEGNGAGAIIQSPSTLTPDAIGLMAVVELNNAATVNINNLTVQGPVASGQVINAGILVVGGATADVTNSSIADIAANPLTGVNNTGNGIQVGTGQGGGQTGHATITNCTITDYQKTGIITGGPGTTVTIAGNTITGVGPETRISQNGIQISAGTIATVSNNSISNNEFTGTNSGPNPLNSTQAIGILNFSDSSSFTGNTVFGNDLGILSTNSVTTGAGTTISGNTVQGSFEGIFLDQGTNTVSDNNITGNNIGVAVIPFAGTAQSTLLSNNITNNGNVPVSFPGGGIILLNGAANTTALLTAHFNRIVGNAVGLNNETATTADALNNFWGSNAGPGGEGSDTVAGPVDFGPWLLFLLTASPNPVAPGGTSTVVATFTINRDGVDTSALGHVPDGIPVVFSVSPLGTISPTMGTTVSGIVDPIFTAGTTPGTTVALATADNQTSGVQILIQAPSPIQITGTPRNGMYARPFSFQFQATGPGTITFTGANLPSGLLINLTTGILSGTPTAAGTFQFTITASNGTNTATAEVTLIVAPAPLTITADDKTRVFGVANPPLTATFTGLVNGDTPDVVTGLVLNTTADINSPVGTFPITVSGGVAANYDITFVPGTLTIIPDANPAGPGGGIGVFDPTTGIWHLRNEVSAGVADQGVFAYGLPGWIPVTGDWNNSGNTGIGVFDPTTATWYLRNEANAGAADAGVFQYGLPGWIPVTGDWNGTGETGIGMYDPTTDTWYLRNEANAGAPDAGVFQYGFPGWLPVTGEWTNTGKTGIGVIDPTTGFPTWKLRNEANAGVPDVGVFQYGFPGWLPVTGDWSGTGLSGIGMYDNNTSSGFPIWNLRNEPNAGVADAAVFAYGLNPWVPVVGSWTGAVPTLTSAPPFDALVTGPTGNDAPMNPLDALFSHHS